MQIQGAGYVNSSSSVYTDSSAYAACASPSSGVSSQDSSSISAFSGGSGSESAQSLSDLYSQKARAESELSETKGQTQETRSQLNARKEEVMREQQNGDASNQLQEEYEKARAEYEEASTAKDQAQQELDQVSQESSANEQAINANAQQKQQVSSEINSVQSQLASLTPPSPPSGDDPEAQADYQAKLSAYQEQKNQLENKLNVLQQELQQLEQEAQRLLNAKMMLMDKQVRNTYEIHLQDNIMQDAQAKMDEAEHRISDENPEVKQALQDDAELKSLQQEFEKLQQEQAELEAEISQLEAQIADTEAKDTELQAARADEADQAFQDAAEKAGCDVAGAEANAQERAAQDKYGKSYDELSEEEQITLAAEVDGEVTLEVMEAARQMLADDPHNEAAKEVLAKGQLSLEAQDNLAYAEFSESIDNMPAALQDGAKAAMLTSRTEAVLHGEDPEQAAAQALSQYAAEQMDNADMSPEDKAALQNAAGASDNYLNSRGNCEKGQQINQAAEKIEKRAAALESVKEGISSFLGDLGSKIEQGIDKAKRWQTENFGTDAEKLQLAMDDDGIDDESVVYINGTDGDDTIDVKIGKDGSYTITVNGEESVYSAEEARRLMIDGGDGNDHITIHGEEEENQWGGFGGLGGLSGQVGQPVKSVTEQNNEANPDGMDGEGKDGILSGGFGNDTVKVKEVQPAIFINGGGGNDVIDAGDNVNTKLYMTGGDGDDQITGGNADDVIIDSHGNNTVEGGYGNDVIKTGNGSDIITDMGGNNEIHAGGGDDEITLNGSGNSKVYGDDGDDTIIANGWGASEIHGGDGRDTMTATNGRHKLYGDGGDDTMTVDSEYGFIELHGGDGNDTITSLNGEHALYGEDGDDTITGSDKRDYIEGGDGDDTIDGGEGGDVIYGGNGNDTIQGGGGDDFINAGHGDDTVHGGDGNDILFGLAGNDHIYGEGGMDTIAAGDGNDTVDGGDGADIIRYTNSLLHGFDTVLNADEEDDVKALDPIDVPDNFKINTISNYSKRTASGNEYNCTREMSADEAKAFEDLINDNLEAFAAIEPGQQLLQGIAETKHTVTFEALEDPNGYCYKSTGGSGNASITEVDGQRTYETGEGCDSVVKINPTFIDFNNGSAFAEQNNMLVMAHELCHAYNNATGTMDWNSFYNNETGEWMDLPEGTTTEEGWDQRAIRGAELQAVGIYDDSTVYANPYGMSENDYRQYFHMAPRTSYMRQSQDILEDPNTKHGEVANTHLNEDGQYVFDKIDWDSIDLTRPSI